MIRRFVIKRVDPLQAVTTPAAALKRPLFLDEVINLARRAAMEFVLRGFPARRG